MKQIPGQISFIDEPRKDTRIAKSYASPCGGCLCNQCANEVNGKGKPAEKVKPCFNCEDCRNYDGDPHKRINKVTECEEFKITNYQVAMNRSRIKAL